jgi:hypothetical protein
LILKKPTGVGGMEGAVDAKLVIDRVLHHFGPLEEQDLMAYCYILQHRLRSRGIAVANIDFRLYGKRLYSHTIPVHLRELIFAGYIKEQQGSRIFQLIRSPQLPKSYQNMLNRMDNETETLKKEGIKPLEAALELYGGS